MQTCLNVTLYVQLAVLLLPARWFRLCFDQCVSRAEVRLEPCFVAWQWVKSRLSDGVIRLSLCSFCIAISLTN